MTEKDFYKFKSYKTNRMNYLKVSFELEQPEKFIKKIKEVYAKKD